MIFYAIREKSTGYYLPQIRNTKQRGYSHTEPRPGFVPRLHLDKNTAIRCLTQWLRGRAKRDWDGDLIITPISERKKENMEIVEVKLFTKTNYNSWRPA